MTASWITSSEVVPKPNPTFRPRYAPKMHQNAPKMQQKCTKNAPKCNKNAPKMHQKAPDMPTGWEWKEEGYLIWFSLTEKMKYSNVSGFRAKTFFFQLILT